MKSTGTWSYKKKKFKIKNNLLCVVNEYGGVPVHDIPPQESSHDQEGDETSSQEPPWVHPFPATSPQLGRTNMVPWHCKHGPIIIIRSSHEEALI